MTAEFGKKPKVICLGRAGVDLYAVEEGVPFNEVKTFRKSFGGSPANIAVGLSRLGVQTGFIGKVSDDMVGHAVISFLNTENVDTTGIQIDSTGSRTGIAITETRPENCGVVLYRNAASDLMITPEEINEAFIGSAQMLVVSGTALSITPSRDAAFRAIQLAKQNGVKVFLDLDYRPYSWSLPKETAEIYLAAVEQSDYLIGNTEEFECFAALDNYGGVEQMIQRSLDMGVEVVVHKMGGEGSCGYWNKEMILQGAYTVPVKKPFGAGDAYAASFIHGLLYGIPLADAMRNGAAAAAIVVSEFGCAESMPTRKQIQYFIKNYPN